MKVDEAVSLAARAAMRSCDEGMNPDEWAEFADYAVEAAAEAALAVKAAGNAAGSAQAGELERAAFRATLDFAVAGLLTLAHLECLERVNWPE